MDTRASEISARNRRDWKYALYDALEAMPSEVAASVKDHDMLDSDHPDSGFVRLAEALVSRLSRGTVGPDAAIAAAVLYGALMYGPDTVTTGLDDFDYAALIAVDKASVWQSDYRAKVWRTDSDTDTGRAANLAVEVRWNGSQRYSRVVYGPDATDEVSLMGKVMYALHLGWMP